MRIGWLSLIVVSYTLSVSVSQGRDLPGTWALEAEAANGVGADGNGWSANAIKGTLVIDQSEDTLKGTWTGPSGKPWSLAGRVENGKFEVVTEPRSLTVTINGQPSTMNARWVFRGSVSGDTMTGTVRLSADDDQNERFQPFTANRR